MKDYEKEMCTTVHGRCLNCKHLLEKNLKRGDMVLAAKNGFTKIYMVDFTCKTCAQPYVGFSEDNYHMLHAK